MLRLLRFGVVIVISSILSLVVVALTKNERSRMKGLRLLGFQQGFLDGFSKPQNGFCEGCKGFSLGSVRFRV